MTRRAQTRLDLMDLLNERKFDNALLATFQFDARFFETFCLDDLRAFEANDNIGIMLDRRSYDELLDRRPDDRPAYANRRYVLQPVGVPGVFHPKLLFLTSPEQGLLVVGSSNLTRPGMTSNAELVGCFRFEVDKEEGYKDLFGDALAFLSGAGARWGCEAFGSQVEEVVEETPWLLQRDGESRALEGLRLVSNLDESILDQASRDMGGEVRRIRVVSRFFDQDPGLLDLLLDQFSPDEVLIFTQNDTTTMTPAWLRHRSVKEGKTKLFLCEYEDEGHHQNLHAKALAFEQRDATTLIYGSPNFTHRGLLSTADSGNVEIAIVQRLAGVSEAQLTALFDPSGSADRLVQVSDLRSTTSPPPPAPHEPSFWLEEARLEDGELECVVRGLGALGEVTVEALCRDGSRHTLKLLQRGMVGIEAEKAPTRWVALIPPEVLPRLRLGVASVCVVSSRPGAPPKSSNRVFVIDPVAVPTIRDRRLRSAERSPEGFVTVLRDLLRSGDVDALLRFLNLCDISLRTGPRSLGPVVRPPKDGPLTDLVRSLAIRDRQYYEALHEAACDFIERHLSRLERGTNRPTLTGVPSFMHVARAVGDVIRMQLERSAVWIEGASQPIGFQEWTDWKNQLHAYLMYASSLIAVVGRDWVSELRRSYEEGELASALQPDLDPLLGFWEAVKRNADRARRASEQRVRCRRLRGTA